eukprot:CCRYP_016004-RC/>CCRYP_016004-RC protein AED:0.16 eAED:0.16 QI:481/1/1/1/0.71/0.62/8/121/335
MCDLPSICCPTDLQIETQQPKMSRLNATLKLLFCIGEGFFIIVSLGFAAASCLIVLGKVNALAFSAAQEMAKYSLILSVAVFLCTCFGCCGAIRQSMRKGCSGRRILCMNQQLKYEWLTKRELSIKLVISSDSDYPEYDAFEKSLDEYFNGAYFESLCSDDPSTTWLLNFVDEHCPPSMSKDYCALSGSKKATCDTSCSNLDSECCPSETLCAEGNNMGCPYHKCRVQILEELFAWAWPFKVAAVAVCFLSAFMLVLSCLLICFNPRDDIEIELLKSGVMTEDDIEAIRRLKESRNVKTERGGKINFDSLHKQNDGKFGYSRKRLNRISPTNSDA